MSEAPQEPPDGPAEKRLLALLALLRAEAGRVDEAMVERVMRRARIQGGVKELLRAMNALAYAFSGGLSIFFRRGARRSP